MCFAFMDAVNLVLLHEKLDEILYVKKSEELLFVCPSFLFLCLAFMDVVILVFV